MGLAVEIIVDAGCNRHNRELALKAAGYTIVRHFYRLYRSLTAPLDEPRIPSGYSFRAMSSLDEMPRWVEAYNNAFADHWHFHEKTLAEALQFATHDPNYRPEGDIIALCPDGVIAGFCQCMIRSNENRVRGRREGWISLLGVCQSHRRLGLGSALLRTGLRWLQKEGMTTARLGVDAASPTGATMLYGAAGFEVVQQRSCWGVVVDSISDLVYVQTSFDLRKYSGFQLVKASHALPIDRLGDCRRWILFYLTWAIHLNRKCRSVVDYLVSGRSVRMWLGMGAGIAGEIGLIDISAMCEQGYRNGYSFVLLNVLSLLIVVPLFGIFGFGIERFRATRCISVPQYIEMRFSKNLPHRRGHRQLLRRRASNVHFSHRRCNLPAATSGRAQRTPCSATSRAARTADYGRVARVPANLHDARRIPDIDRDQFLSRRLRDICHDRAPRPCRFARGAAAEFGSGLQATWTGLEQTCSCQDLIHSPTTPTPTVFNGFCFST